MQSKNVDACPKFSGRIFSKIKLLNPLISCILFQIVDLGEIMKYYLALLIFLTFAAPTMAQEIILYDQMTYEQLKEVDPSSLSKVDKKAWKKAHKKAKKAHQKAERKRKKLEKKQAKAEAKRRKAEEKARKKANKHIQNQLDLVATTYANTQIIRDDFEAHVTIASQFHTNERALFGVKDETVDNRYRLRGFYYPDRDNMVLQLVVSQRIKTTSLTSNNIDSIRNPISYMTKNGYWPNFSRATLRGGINKPVVQMERYLDRCSFLECNFREVFSIELLPEDIVKTATSFQPLQIKISGASGTSFIETIPSAYILGFLKKLGNVNSEGAKLTETIQTAENLIRSQLQ